MIWMHCIESMFRSQRLYFWEKQSIKYKRMQFTMWYKCCATLSLSSEHCDLGSTPGCVLSRHCSLLIPSTFTLSTSDQSRLWQKVLETCPSTFPCFQLISGKDPVFDKFELAACLLVNENGQLILQHFYLICLDDLVFSALNDHS